MPSNIPLSQIQKQLRSESLYGCAVCGCPILEFVNMTTNSLYTEVFLPENMVALCPSHHTMYTTGAISKPSLYDAKNSPHNKVHQEDVFSIPESLDLSVNIGRCTFINTSRILVVHDFDIISIKMVEGKYILLDINFFDKLNNLIAIVSENTWSAEKRSKDWIISYKPRHLTIQNQQKNTMFDAKMENYTNEITLTADGLYYDGSLIKITEEEILCNGEEIATELKGTKLKNYEVGIAVEGVLK
jgi:hypothetical protein